jgi:hypothetical protein
MAEDHRLTEIAKERARAIAPEPTRLERYTVWFMLIVPGIFGGMFLADAAFYIRAIASSIWLLGFIYSYWWVLKRGNAHQRAFDSELAKLSRR